ncbi:t-complex protein 1 subunit gamma, putative [Ichthyophthirius multifiliis]|uniref:T-complex protein 1 subunit gamma n=1 Tax=Ichthyophthirius multifiliis TaxID=5932 RepID=G0R4A0_ICHMU|nr:t-complex protein 1 subunit gamma, putative [Ichthyophthirius multifiliis]EGR27711.1 t-complex protein 1 subunit gamma, putative [Ichthyophthirius multifiliis]|eukprot:XP_004025163.1 t-complex protein 1 subunit gamma, putative [Ichthyophthirius multifiliis]
MQGGHQPIMVLNTNTKRESGKKAQLANIAASKAVADIVTSTLGPRSMLKMLLDPMGGIVMTNDGNAILREIDVNHPAAKSMIELARVQDEEVGDGTTSVIILAGEMMLAARPFIERNIHPTIIVQAYYKALQEATKKIEELGVSINVDNDDDINKALASCIGTKFTSRWGKLITDLSLKAVRTIMRGGQVQKLNLEIKRYAKVEKIPGGLLEDSCVLDGVMFNKDITHPKMRRYIKNPRVILLDCPLEYKKGESMTNLEMMKESDMTDALQQEMEELALMCSDILKHNPDVVITEKGVSDLAQHYLLKQNVTVIRRVRKTDNNRISRVTGATIVNRPEELQESDVGKKCGLFEVKKIGDEYFTFMTECQNPEACSIILRGASKDVLNEMERNLHDCLAVAKNIFVYPKLVPGGGAIEMEVASHLEKISSQVEGLYQLPFRAVAYALEVIPKTLAQNCGVDVVRTITELRSKHNQEGNKFIGIEGTTGKIQEMDRCNVWEPIAVKLQVYKTAIESACMLLRIDDVVSGLSKQKNSKGAATVTGADGQAVPEETFGDARDG